MSLRTLTVGVKENPTAMIQVFSLESFLQHLTELLKTTFGFKAYDIYVNAVLDYTMGFLDKHTDVIVPIIYPWITSAKKDASLVPFVAKLCKHIAVDERRHDMAVHYCEIELRSIKRFELYFRHPEATFGDEIPSEVRIVDPELEDIK